MIVQYHSITYIKIRVPFHAIFKDSSQKPHPHILKLLTFRMSSRTIHTINKAPFLNMYQIYVSLLPSLYIKIMFTLKYQIMKRE